MSWRKRKYLRIKYVAEILLQDEDNSSVIPFWWRRDRQWLRWHFILIILVGREMRIVCACVYVFLCSERQHSWITSPHCLENGLSGGVATVYHACNWAGGDGAADTSKLNFFSRHLDEAFSFSLGRTSCFIWQYRCSGFDGAIYERLHSLFFAALLFSLTFPIKFKVSKFYKNIC